MNSGRGRKQGLTNEEEQIIVDAALELASNGTPIDKHCFLDLAKTFISNLPSERRAKLSFVNDRPSKFWLESFFKRHSELTLRKSVAIEQARAEATKLENISKHFARINTLMDKYNI